MKKKMIAVIISILLAMSLIACAGNTGENGTAVSSDTAASQTPSSGKNDEPAPGDDKNAGADENTDMLPGADSTPSPDAEGSSPEGEGTDANISSDDSDMFTNRDLSGKYDDNVVTIDLNGASATASDNGVGISDSVITIGAEATYIISGTLDDGMIIVDAADDAKIQLVLSGADISCETSAAIYVKNADKVFVTLAEGTKNYLSNGGTFEAIDENNIDGVIFSKDDLTLDGSGSLEIISPAGHGIVCKDDLVITAGSCSITSASHGLDANDSVRITGDTLLSIVSGKDGIHCENTDDASYGFVYISGGSFDIEAEGDGISALAFISITGGAFDITSGGGSENGEQESSNYYGNFGGRSGLGGNLGGHGPASTSSGSDDSTSMKGIKAEGDLYISGGSFTLNCADDALHSNSSITLDGGTFEIQTGDDGIHADDTLTVTYAVINISESYEGLEAQHLYIYDGDISLTSSDDGLNASGGSDSSGSAGGRDGMFGGGMSSSSNGSVVIYGGNIYIKASGDGIDANGTLEIAGGYVMVVGPSSGDTATLDYDKSGIITGGTFLGTGAYMMAQTFSDAAQGVIAVSVGSQSAGTKVTITDSAGNTVLEYSPELDFQVVIYSSEEIISGETYTMTVGTISGEITAA